MREDVTYDRLIEITQKNQRYLSGEIDNNGEHTTQMAWNVIKSLQKHTSNVVGGFGVGFPFHSLSSENGIVGNPEFVRYTDSFLEKIELEKKLGSVAWLCARCHEDSYFNPDYCSQCNLSTIKPREVMKVMPDIDMFIIVDEVSTQSMDDIQDISKNYSFHQSDHSLIDSLERIDSVFDHIENDSLASHLPTDLHVISKEDFFYALDELCKGNIDPDVDIYSMYYSWKLNKKISFGFDFLFSGTFNEELCEPDIIEHVNIARKKMVENFSEQEILNIVSKRNKRAEVLLEYGPTRDIFLEKIRGWNTL